MLEGESNSKKALAIDAVPMSSPYPCCQPGREGRQKKEKNEKTTDNKSRDGNLW